MFSFPTMGIAKLSYGAEDYSKALMLLSYLKYFNSHYSQLFQ